MVISPRVPMLRESLIDYLRTYATPTHQQQERSPLVTLIWLAEIQAPLAS